MTYANRQEAGIRLAKVLRHYASKDTVVLALPRGGVVVGAEVAKALQSPLGLVLVRKIGHPIYPEYAIGAIAENDEPVYNESEILGVDEQWLQNAVTTARNIIQKHRNEYYGTDLVPQVVKDKTVIVVDDGIATGLTMEAAVRALQKLQAKRVIVAVPVAPQESVDTLSMLTDRVIVLEDTNNFLGSVGNHYLVFDQVDDEEVKTLLREVNKHVYEPTT